MCDGDNVVVNGGKLAIVNGDNDDMIISGIDVDDSDVNYVDDIEDGDDGDADEGDVNYVDDIEDDDDVGYNEGDGEDEGYTTCKGPLLPTRYTVFTLLSFKASIACSQISVF